LRGLGLCVYGCDWLYSANKTSHRNALNRTKQSFWGHLNVPKMIVLLNFIDSFVQFLFHFKLKLIFIFRNIVNAGDSGQVYASIVIRFTIVCFGYTL